MQLTFMAVMGLVSQANQVLGQCPNTILDLSPWYLQLPIGSPGHPTTVSTSQLIDCYHNQYFDGASDNSVVFRVPGNPHTSGCVTTAHSKHCRTELHGSRIWQPTSSVNRLTADLRVVNPGGSTAIGQVHIDDRVSSKPAIEMYYENNGTITVGVERNRSGGGQVRTNLGRVPVGTRFEYEIRWEKGTIQVGINGNMRVLSQNNLHNPPVYFKAGNYLQGSSPSEVRFYSLHVAHTSSSGDPVDL
ncbi:hypothetical protein VTI28DRAFT_6406 [Corynascus sepedonium]